MDKSEPSLNFLMDRRWSSRLATKQPKPAEPAPPQETSSRGTSFSARNTPFLTEGDSESEVDAEIESDEYKKHKNSASKTTERRKPARAAKPAKRSVGRDEPSRQTQVRKPARPAKRFVAHDEGAAEQSEHNKRRTPARPTKRSIGRNDDDQFELSDVRGTVRSAKRPVRKDDRDDESGEQSEPENTLESSRTARRALRQDFLAKNEFQSEKPESIVYNSLADGEPFAGGQPLMRIRRQANEADAEWAALKSTLEPWEIADIDENTAWAEHNCHVESEAAKTLLEFSAQTHKEAQAAEALLQLHAQEADEEHIGLDENLIVMNTIDRMSFRIARDGGILGERGVWYNRDDANEEYKAIHRLKMMVVDIDLDGDEELKATIGGLLAKLDGWGCSRQAVKQLKEAGELICQYQIQNLIEEAEDGEREVNWRVPPKEAEQL